LIERELARVREEITRGLAPVATTERVALAQAHRRVIARALVSPIDLPLQDVSAMDGYAVRSQDLAHSSATLRVTGRVLAGSVFAGQVGPGECARIMTGAPIPSGADAVVVSEAAQDPTEDSVRLPADIALGANVRRRGEHVRAGSAVLPAGRRLRAEDLALAAAIGADVVDVWRALRVGVLSTGDELRDAPASIGPGLSYDGNRPMLVAALASAGMHTVDLGICPDESKSLERVVDRAFDQRIDALVISGGAALGDADVVRQLGGVRFVPVQFRPGRGIAVAHIARGRQSLLLLGLPGNIVAAYAMFHLVAHPALVRLAGAQEPPPAPIPLELATELHCRGGRFDILRARLIGGDGARLLAQPLADQGSAMIRTVCEADALLAAGPQSHYAAGDPIPAFLLRSLPGS
jgi:molybdopterin molybdotransferase